MLKYALGRNGVDWKKIRVIDAGSPEKMEARFSSGDGDYIHMQAPIRYGEIVASVGAAMPAVAFSSLCCSKKFQSTDSYRLFLNAYTNAREWVRTAKPDEIAAAVAEFFPMVTTGALTDSIARYQALGCWDGGIAIPRDLYEQALNVFQAAGGIAWRHNYEEVVG
jgi:NitT/TauT family transport system substrate-binding protein